MYEPYVDPPTVATPKLLYPQVFSRFLDDTPRLWISVPGSTAQRRCRVCPYTEFTTAQGVIGFDFVCRDGRSGPRMLVISQTIQQLNTSADTQRTDFALAA